MRPRFSLWSHISFALALKYPDLFISTFLWGSERSPVELDAKAKCCCYTNSLGKSMCYVWHSMLIYSSPTCLTVSIRVCATTQGANPLVLILLIFDSSYLSWVSHMMKPRQADKCTVFPESCKLPMNTNRAHFCLRYNSVVFLLKLQDSKFFMAYIIPNASLMK